MERKLRDACDSCHVKKTKCSSTGTGACSNCRLNSTSCTYSPRDQMGRPTKQAAKDLRKKRPTAKPVQPQPSQTYPDAEDLSVPGLDSSSSISQVSSGHSSDCLNSLNFDNMDFDTELHDLDTSPYSLFNSSFSWYGNKMSPPNSMMPAEQPGGKPWNAPMMEHDMASFYDSDVVTGDGRPLIQAAGVSQPRQTQPSSESPSKPYHPAESLGQKSQPPELQPGVGLNSGRGAALNSFLCRFVFTLRACGGHSWKADNTSELQDSQQVFDLISNFCDVMHEQVLPHCGSASALEDVDISNVAMLVTTAISLVINAYTSHLDAFIRMGGDKRPSITRAQTTPDFRRSPSMSEPSSRLGSLLQFTVMDFHTSQLRAILDHLNSQESLKSVMKSAGDCMIDIEHLRCRVIETSSNLKAVLQ